MFDNLIKGLIIFLDGYSTKIIIGGAVVGCIIVGIIFKQTYEFIVQRFPDKTLHEEESIGYETTDSNFTPIMDNGKKALQDNNADTLVLNGQLELSNSEELSMKLLKKEVVEKGNNLINNNTLQNNIYKEISNDTVMELSEKKQILNEKADALSQNLEDIKELSVTDIPTDILKLLQNPTIKIIKVEPIIFDDIEDQEIIITPVSPVEEVKPVVIIENNTPVIITTVNGDDETITYSQGGVIVDDDSTDEETTQGGVTVTTLDDGTTITTDGEVTIVVEPDGTITTTDGETTTTVEPDGTTTTTDGTTTTTVEPDGTTTTTNGDITTTVEPDGTITTTDGETTTTVEPNGTTITTDGEVTIVVEPDGTTITTDGETTTTVDPDGTTTTVNGVITVITEPDGSSNTFEALADEDVVTDTTNEIQPEVVTSYFNNNITIDIGNNVQKSIKIATQSVQTPTYPETPDCPYQYSPIATYSNIGLNQHIFSRTKEKLPYVDSSRGINIDMRDEYSVSDEGMRFDYKVFTVNEIKIGAITYKTENPTVDYHWILQVCLRD